MDEREDSPGGVYSTYDYNLYIYNIDNTTRQIEVDFPEEEAHLWDITFDEEGTLYAYVYAPGGGSIYKNRYKTKIPVKVRPKSLCRLKIPMKP